jgi:endo-1,3-1,4-beta-glycanase ExoK
MFRNFASMSSARLSSAIFALVTLGSTPAFAVSGAELYRGEALRYGRFEARVQFAPGDGVVSSFFLWKNGSELADTYWNEIDVEKVGADCTSYSSNALYGNPEASHTEEIPAGFDLCTGYHTHVVEWTPTYLAWLLDGVEVRRLTGADLQAFEENALPGMQIRFNIWVGNASFGGTFAPESLPLHQYINWVSYSAYTPGLGEGGSDFSATWREDFSGALPAGWSLGNWPSPFNNSVHSPANFTVVDGKAVLSLTADDATGFTGQPPEDPEYPEPGLAPAPTSVVPTPSTSVAPTPGTSVAPPPGGPSAAPAASEEPEMTDGEAGGCDVSGRSSGASTWTALLLFALGGGFHLRRLQTGGRRARRAGDLL